MDVTNSDSISQINDRAAREMQLSREDQSDLDVPVVGEDNQNRVTQSAKRTNCPVRSPKMIVSNLPMLNAKNPVFHQTV